MKKLNCLIVDDEPIARDILEIYCQHFPNLQVLPSCPDAFSARQLLQNQEIDLMFLDVQMPVLDGVGFVQTLKKPPLIIFTTAYTDYAVKAFELSAIDYLIKPFSLERFIIALDKVLDRLGHSKQIPQSNAILLDYFFVKTEGKQVKILFSDLQFVEAKGNFIQLITQKDTHKVYQTFSQIESILSHKRFIRCHRSFIVNAEFIKEIEGNLVQIDSFKIPIGKQYREDFLKTMGL
jgi:two-component system, LytTR family, response regulator